MSDDELPPMGDAENNFEDDMSVEEEDLATDATKLPDGIKKEVISEAPADTWRTPKRGDEVTVHYVGTLEADGSEFDSSRSRAKPFTFTLGKGMVIKGWDFGVATMKKGEVAKFTLSSEFAYGDGGSPPKIPEKATLIFEIELISWASKDDLFGDEGVIKSVMKDGRGWRTPKDGEEVLITFKVETMDGSETVEERSNCEYVMGSDGLGPVSKAVEKGLTTMKKGEETILTCSAEYAYGDKKPAGAKITLTLIEMYETKDVSAAKDGSVMKKQVREGEGYEHPSDVSLVKLSVESATDGEGTVLPGFGGSKVLEFKVGNGEVCDALEFAVKDMKKGERAVITVHEAKMALEEQLGLKDATAAKVLLTVELQEFEKAKDTWSMDETEKLEYGAARKEVGSALFKAGRVQLALQAYKKVAELFNYVDNYNEENKANAKNLKKLSELNKAACYLKTQDYNEAVAACDAVLKDDKQNVKALYRHAQANLYLKNFQDCIQDCKKVVEIDAQNKDARTLLKQAQIGQKEEDKKSKGLFANMCKALGKGPIPEPYKEKKPYGGDDYDDEDEDDMPPLGESEGVAAMEDAPAQQDAAASESKE